MRKGKTVTVTQCLDILREEESVSMSMKRMDEATSKVEATYNSRDPTKQSQAKGTKSRYSYKPRHKTPQDKHVSNPNQQVCPWCSGSKHPRDKCPAKDSTCKYCGKAGHFSKVCFKKQMDERCRKSHAIVAENDNDDSYEGDFDLASIDVDVINSPQSPREVLANVTFPRHHTIIGKVDTGAMVSCMPLSMLHQTG